MKFFIPFVFAVAFFAIPSFVHAADRYWVGGTGDWNDTAHWSASSGGASGVAAPTSVDDVYFDVNSSAVSYTVNLLALSASFRNFSVLAKPATGDITIAGSGASANVFGAISVDVDVAVGSILGQLVNFYGTSSVKLPVGMYLARTCYIQTGTLTFQSNLQMLPNWSSTFSLVAGAAINANGYKLTIYSDPTTARGIYGGPTLHDLEIIGNGYVAFTGNTTLTGTLTILGIAANNRILVASGSLGTQKTITAAAVSLGHVDFMDIAGAGAAAPFTGTSLGDALGNSGITFTPSATQYWYTTTTGTKTWSTAGNWFLGSGGTGGAGRVPLPQDDVIFDASSIGAASTTINLDMPRAGKDITWTGVTNTPAFAPSVGWMLYGSLTLDPAMTWTGSLTWSMKGRSALTLTTAGITVPGNVQNWTLDGSVTLQDALTFDTASSKGLSHFYGAFDANDFNVTSTYLTDGASTLTRSIDMGTGTWTITGNDTSGAGGAWVWGVTAGASVTPSTSTIKFTDATANAKSFKGGGLAYNNLWLSGAGTGNFVITGSNTFNDFKADTPSKTIIFTAGTTQTVNTWHVDGQAPDGSTVKFGQLFGTAGGYFSTPDSVANSQTGNFTIDAYVNPSVLGGANPIVISKWVTSGNQRSYALEFLANKISGAVSADGIANSVVHVSSVDVVTGVGDAKWIRWEFTVNSSGSSTSDFYTSTDDITYTKQGSTVSSTAIAGVFNSTSALEIGSFNSGANNVLSGSVRRARLYSGVVSVGGATVVTDYDPNDQTTGATWNASTTGETWTVNGNAIVAGTNEIALTSSTTASFALVKNSGPVVRSSYLNIWHSVASPSSTWYAGTSSTNNNSVTTAGSGWVFTNPVGKYWVGGTGNWSDTTHWSASSGGAGSAGVPTSTDDVYFDSASNATAYTVTVDAAATTRDLVFFAAPSSSGTVTFTDSATLNVYGNISLLSGMTFAANGVIWTQKASGTQTITSNGVTITSTGTAFRFNGAGIVQLVDTLRVSGSLLLAAGTFDPNGQDTILNSTSGSTLTGTFTFYKLTRTGAANTVGALTLANDITVTDTFTVTGAAANQHVIVQSSVLGTPRTITAAAVSLSNVDFMDITGAGAATWSGTSLGDALGNSGITFTTAATQYWYTTTTGTKTWSTAGNWFLGSGGTGGAGRVPLPQDNVVFDASSIGAASTTVSADMPRLGRDIDWTGVTNSPTFSSAASTAWSIYGSATFVSGMTVSENSGMSFYGRGTHTLTSAGRVFNGGVNFFSVGGTYTLTDNFSCGNYTQLISGTLTAQGDVTSGSITISTGGTAKTVNMGPGTWTVASATGSWVAGASLVAVNADTSTIKFTGTGATSKQFSGGGYIYNNLWLSGAGTGNFTITGSNTFNDFKADTPPHTIIFTAGTTQTVNTWHVSGQALDGNTVKFGQVFATSGGYFSTPDSVANSITGDIDIAVRLSADDWTPATSNRSIIGKYNAAPNVSYLLELRTTGALLLYSSSDGSTIRSDGSSAATGFSDGTTNWIRVTRSAATGNVIFYTAADQLTVPASWTQLGSTQAGTAGGIYDGAQTLNVGAFGAGGVGDLFAGKIYRTRILNGIDGTLAVNFNPNDQTTGATWNASTTGETWTVNGNAIVAGTNEIALTSSTTASFALAKSGGGTASGNYMNIWHSVATPASTWFATNSTDNQSVTTVGSGWIFAAPPASSQFKSGGFQLKGGGFKFK